MASFELFSAAAPALLISAEGFAVVVDRASGDETCFDQLLHLRIFAPLVFGIPEDVELERAVGERGEHQPFVGSASVLVG